MPSDQRPKWIDRVSHRVKKATGRAHKREKSPVRPPATPEPEVPQSEKDIALSQPTVNVDQSTVSVSEKTVVTDQSTALSNPAQLWDRAYDSIRSEEPGLVELYEKILTQQLQDDSNESAKNAIEQNDWVQRRDQMCQVLRNGLDKNKKTAKIEERVDLGFSIILSVKSAVDLGLKSVPTAAVAWAGVCIALQLALNPLKEAKTARDGVSSVILRMKWYSSLSVLLLQHPEEPNDRLDNLRMELAECIYELYKTLLKYIFSCVCFLNRHPALSLLRNAIKLDDWTEKLDDITKAERMVNTAANDFGARQSTSYLNLLLNMHRSSEDEQLMQSLNAADMSIEIESLQNRKDHLLEDAYKWVLDNEAYRTFMDRGATDARLLWIRGDPGKGKTMLLIGIIRELTSRFETHFDGFLITYFLCQGTNNRLNTASSIIRGLIWMLIRQERSLIRHLKDAIKDIGSSAFEDQTSFYTLKRVLQAIFDDRSIPEVYLIVDALDECRLDEPGLIQLLDFITMSSARYNHVKWLVSSRNVPLIESKLEHNLSAPQLSLELNSDSVSSAVEAYINYKLEILIGHYRDRLGRRMTPSRKDKLHDLENELRLQMETKADGTFLWVALAFKELERCGADQALNRVQQLPSSLDDVYNSILKRVEQSHDFEQCKKVLLVMANVYRPLKLCEIAILADLSELAVQEDIIRHCGILTLRTNNKIDEEPMVYFVHQSAKDFLVKMPMQSTATEIIDRIFPRGHQQGHRCIFSESLERFKDLHRDLWDLRDPAISIEEALKARPSSNPLEGIEYSCIHWADHFCDYVSQDAELEACDIRSLYPFVTERLLYWLEAMSLLGEFSKAILSIRRLIQRFRERVSAHNQSSTIPTSSTQLGSPELGIAKIIISLLKGLERLVLFARDAIESTPLQIYGGALAFSPTKSLLKPLYWDQRFPFLERVVGISNVWDDCLLTIDHSCYSERLVVAVAFSEDGDTIASLYNDTVYLRDTATGSLKLSFSSDFFETGSRMEFTPDGQFLVSVTHLGNRSRTLVWDARTGHFCTQIPEKASWSWTQAHIGLAPDSRRIAVSVEPASLRVYAIQTGILIQELDFSSKITGITGIIGLRFSLDGHSIYAISREGQVLLWHLNTEEIKEIHDFSSQTSGETDYVLMSTNSDKVLVTSSDIITGEQMLHVLDLENGACIALTQTRDSCCAISADGRFMAKPTNDQVFELWDLSAAAVVKEIEHGPEPISAVAFAPDSTVLASAGSEGTVHLWKVTVGPSEPRHSLKVIKYIAISPNGQSTAATFSISGQRKIGLWNRQESQFLVISQESDWDYMQPIFSPDSKLLASATNMWECVSLWDTGSGKLLQRWEDCAQTVGASFSSDSRLLSFVCHAGIKVVDILSGHCDLIKTPRKYLGLSRLNISFTPDNKKLLIAEQDGSEMSILDLTSMRSSTVRIDGSSLISDTGGDENVFRIEAKDGPTRTKEDTELDSPKNSVSEYTYSPKSRMLAYQNGSKVYVFDVLRNTWTHEFENECSGNEAISFSSDGNYLITPKKQFSLALKSPYFDIRNGWIRRDGQKVLWIHPQYRFSESAAQWNSQVILGLKSDGDVYVEFTEDERDFDFNKD